MQRFNLDPRLANRLALVVIAIIIFSMGRSGQLDWLQSLLTAPLTPVQSWLSEQFGLFAGTFEDRQTMAELEAENSELRAQVNDLESELARLRESDSEREVLAAILDYARAYPEPTYLPADVIARDSSPLLSFLILNRGRVHGVQPDMPVVSSQGLVGIITEVTASLSKVLLITDPNMAVNARLQESRVQGVINGQGTGTLLLKFVEVDTELVTGETLITSGLGGTFPPEIPIGTVSSVQSRTFDLFQSADITPKVDFSQLEIVLIITNFEAADLDPLLSTPVPATP